MKRIYSKISGVVRILIIFLVMLAVMFPETGSAASVSISSTGGTIETGETITVSISLSSSSTIGAYRFYLNYDSSVIEYIPSAGDENFCNGGSGTLVFVGDPYNSSASCSIKFKGVSAGTSKLTITSDSGDVLDSDYNDLTVSTSSGSVTVNPPREASSDATLKSLQIGDGAISPKFSSEVTEYSISVNASTDALTIDAQPNSSYAKVSISGNDLEEGANTVKVTVTAENGDTKTYYIYVTKATATPTPSPEPTATPTNTPIPTPGVEVVVDSVKVDKEGNVTAVELTYTLADTITATIPDGFELTGVTINGLAIEALKLNDGDLTLIQLSDGALYVYDKDSGKIYPYQTMVTSSRNYRISRAPEGKIPVGYSLTAIEFDGKIYPAYRLSAEDEFVLVYVEESQWYKYDTVESTIQRYDESAGEKVVVITQAPSGDENRNQSGDGSNVRDELATEASAGGEIFGDGDIIPIIKIVIIVLVFLLAILFLILYVRERNRNLGYLAEEQESYAKQYNTYGKDDYDVESDVDEEDDYDVESDVDEEDDYDKEYDTEGYEELPVIEEFDWED